MVKPITISKLLKKKVRLFTEERISGMNLYPLELSILLYIRDRNSLGVMPQFSKIYEQFRDMCNKESDMRYILDKLAEKKLVTKIPLEEIHILCKTKSEVPGLRHRMDIATENFIEQYRGQTGRMKFYLAMTKNEDGEPTYNNILSNLYV